MCNCVIESLFEKNFSLRSFEEKTEILAKGRPTPNMINLIKTIETPSTKCKRKFNVDIYNKNSWITGCELRNSLYCWPCLLFSKENSVWTSAKGYSDLNNLSKAIKNHSGIQHKECEIMLKLFGKTRIENIINKSRILNIQLFNEKVKKIEKLFP